MAVQTVPSPMTIADYCAAMQRNEIITNKEYQRSDLVWPPVARSFLIETILQGYPIPKIFLFQRTDLKSKKTIKEIVDGQQRSKTIFDFFTNELRLSKRTELDQAAGKIYDGLDDDLKGRFLNYQLSIDLFVSVTPSEIRESFRRLNSYTVPLKPEEQRHAEYQGLFKWFVYHLTREYEEAFLRMGVLSEKQIVRMQDAKLISELIHALLNGITTTNSKSLNKLYKDKDRAFAEEAALKACFAKTMDFLISLPEIHDSPLMKAHVFYSLFLAVSHMLQPCEALQNVFAPPQPYTFERDVVLANLTALAQALELEEDAVEEKFRPFVTASTAKTNVESQRKIRVEWLGKALLPALL
jgi:Protein of unknown function DUF262